VRLRRVGFKFQLGNKLHTLKHRALICSRGRQRFLPRLTPGVAGLSLA
jgi:hypothetical protein